MSRFTDGSTDQRRNATAGPAVGTADGRPDAMADHAIADPLLGTIVGDVTIERVIGAGGDPLPKS
jgi:hypothetical protein